MNAHSRFLEPDNQPLVDIFLHGPLGERFGFHHRLAVRTPREAVFALESQHDGFLVQFAKTEIYGIHCDGEWRDGDSAPVLTFGRELHFCPQIEGRAFLGAALVGAIFPAIAGTTAATVIGGLLFAGLMIGVSMFLSPKAKTVDKTQETERDRNYAFTGPENVTQQGVPVPLIYGRVHAGTVVVSAGLEVGEIADGLITYTSLSPQQNIEEAELVVYDRHRPLIAGMGGGGGKGGGGGSSHTPVEAPDNLKSRQVAKVVDVLSEGPIRGIAGEARGIFLDGVALQNADGTYNYSNVILQFRYGYPAQAIMNGFAAQQAETAVNVKVRYPSQPGMYITRSILNTDVDRCRVTVSTPTLQSVNTTTGDVSGSMVQYGIEIQNAGGGWQGLGVFTISGKTTANYQRAVVFALPRPGPWNIRLFRYTHESTVQSLQNDLMWDSFTEIIDDRVNYTLTACVGIQIDAEQFTSIPKRTYLVDGLLVYVPSNYDPDNATYSGTWDGTFKTAWTNNPCWVFFDLVVNRRYGIGEFVGINLVEKWIIYSIGAWCDQRVPDGKGGYQRRYTCNVQVMTQSDAFDLLNQITSIFRGFSYWYGGVLMIGADRPGDPYFQYTNANVIDGQFTYSGSDLRAKHTMASVAWRDPAQLGETRLAIVEDQPGISRYGIQKTELTAFGCTNEPEALRAGKWALYSELYEGEALQFSTGLESAWVVPGSLIRVMDALISGPRRGGRLGEGNTDTHIVFDAPVSFVAGQYYWLSCIIGDEGRIETRTPHYKPTGEHMFCEVSVPFSEAPKADTIWVMNDPGDLEPTIWRTIGTRQTDPDRYEISAIRYYPSKWDYIERNLALTIPDVTDIVARPLAVTNLGIVEYLVATSPISVGVRVTLSWTSTAPMFDIFWRVGNNNWQHVRTDQKSVDLDTTEGPNQFTVTPIGIAGIKGPTSSLNYDVIGRFALPGPPRLFRIAVNEGIALFNWQPATELDVIIGGHFELRHSSLTSGATWNASQTVIPSIPGTATSVEAGYVPGTWFLRTYDILGLASQTWATILALAPDDRFTRWMRVCEQPDWLGSKIYTEIRYPQEWLVIGYQGGLWDDQTEDFHEGGLDAWEDIDLLPTPPDALPRENWGTYRFDHRFDAGGVFSIRLSSEILAFPFADPDEFFDSRLIDSDTWEDWDDVTPGLAGEISLLIRTTDDDPALASASWTEWKPFTAGEYQARGFEFMAVLSAPPGENIGIEQLCIIGDFKSKHDKGDDVLYAAHDTTIAFNVKFYLVPSLVLTVQDALATDQIQVVDKTREYFTIHITNAGSQVVRTFDWQAQGY